MNTTVRMVLAGQSANPAIAREGLQLIERTYGPPGQFIYAVAGAPYFAIGTADSSTTLTPDQVIAALSTAIDNGSVTYHYEENAALARWYGMPYVAYEGGPDTFGPNNVAAKRAAQFDPRMKDLVVRYLNNWYAYGFGLFSDRLPMPQWSEMFHGNDERVDQESLRLSVEVWEAIARDLLG